MRQWVAGVLVLALLGVLTILVFAPPTVLLDPGNYERTSVTVFDQNDTLLGTVDVKIADTSEKRQVGLSRTDSLEENEGMLFVHPETGSYSYNMRNMSFALDIVFIAANGTVTTIHHAEPTGRFSLTTYTGEGKYVLEVEQGWTNETGVDTGDTVQVPENATASSSES